MLKFPSTVVFYKFVPHGKSGISFELVKDPRKSHFAIYDDGSYYTTKYATPEEMASNPFIRIDKRTNAYILIMKIEGKGYYSTLGRLFDYAFEDDLPEWCAEQVKRGEQYMENLKNGVFPKWKD